MNIKCTMFKAIGLMVFVTLFTFFCLFQSTANASNPANTVVGAIRWDGFYGPAAAPAWDVGQLMETTLGPNQYHFRLPFFGVETGINSVEVREITQEIMDQDIAYAKYASIDYWAFVYYSSGTGMDIARSLYDSSTSPSKSSVNYCFIIDSAAQLPASDFSDLVSRFAQSNYQKVLNNRPLLYLFSDSVYTASEITSLRNLAAVAGVGDPYIVIMDFSSSTASNAVTNLGADAISSYATTTGGGGAYSGLVSSESSKWNDYKNTGKKVIPWITTGWDPRPRIDNPVHWTSYPSDAWTQTATPAEIASHLQEGLNWVHSNSSSAEANTVLMYAWDEFDEGGWLTPTLYAGTDRLDAIKAVLQPNAGNIISNPSFENGTTEWSAQAASISANSANAHSGTNAIKISNRSAHYGAATQDIKDELLAYGQGDYSASVWVQYASGSDVTYIVINTVDSAGSHWFSTGSSNVGTSYTQLSGIVNVTWTGTLSSAIMYTQSNSSTADMYEDDFTLYPVFEANLLTNSGFEGGTTGWSAQTATIATDPANARSGNNAVKISNRGAAYGAATQDVKRVLLANGQRDYQASAWAKFASGSDSAFIVINTVDSNGSHWFSTSPSSVGTSYSQLSGTLHVNWTGTLSSAIMYIQCSSSTNDMYQDDFVLK